MEKPRGKVRRTLLQTSNFKLQIPNKRTGIRCRGSASLQISDLRFDSAPEVGTACADEADCGDFGVRACCCRGEWSDEYQSHYPRRRAGCGEADRFAVFGCENRSDAFGIEEPTRRF